MLQLQKKAENVLGCNNVQKKQQPKNETQTEKQKKIPKRWFKDLLTF